MIQPKKNTKGETILETIIALSILSIGIVFSGTIIGTSLRNINATKNRIIAVNIAREGIEAMRNIRDTNWLKFSNKRRQCWNHDPNPAFATCDGSDEILPGDYIIYKEEENEKWRLGPIEIPDPEIPEKFLDTTKLSLVDIDTNVDTDGDRNKTNDIDAYNHILTEDGDALGRDNAVRTVFKRSININYIDNDGVLITDPANLTVQHNRMRIVANVTWQEGKNQFSTQLATHLTDYLGREMLTN